jgi:hypothetical protein
LPIEGEDVVAEYAKGMESIVSTLKELETRASAAPWEAQGSEVPGATSEADAELIAFSRNELPKVLEFVEKAMTVAERANELLVNAYSLPADEKGMHFNSEDAIKLQWALRSIGIGDDSGEPCFTV